MPKISDGLHNSTNVLSSLTQEEIGKLSARSIYRITSKTDTGNCAEKVELLRQRTDTLLGKAESHNFIRKFFQKVKNYLGSSREWKTNQQLLTLAKKNLPPIPSSESTHSDSISITPLSTTREEETLTESTIIDFPPSTSSEEETLTEEEIEETSPLPVGRVGQNPSEFKMVVKKDGSTLEIELNKLPIPKEKAMEAFAVLAANITLRVNDIEVELEGSPAIDTGGLSRQLLFNLMKDLVNTPPSSHHFLEFNGKVPSFSEIPIPRNEIKFFQDLGRVLGFILETEFPIGEIFSRQMLNVLFAMRQDPFFLQNIDVYNFNNEETLNRFIPLYDMMSESSYAEEMAKNEAFLISPDGLREDKLNELYSNLRMILGEDEEDNLSMKQKKESILKDQDVLRKKPQMLVQKTMLSLLTVLNEANKQFNFNRVSDGEALANRLLGEPLDRNGLFDQLSLFGLSSTHKKWIENWVRNCSQEQVEQFILATTGSTALAPGDTIMIHKTQLPAGRPCKLSTCSNEVFFNFDEISSEEQLHQLISNVIALDQEFNIE